MGSFAGKEFEFSAVEEDSGAEVGEASEAAGLGIEGLDTAVEACGHGIRDAVSEVGEDAFQMPFKHLGDRDDRFQLTASGPTVLPGKELADIARITIFPQPTKLFLDGQGHPLCFHLTAGQTHESTVLDTLLEHADQTLQDGNGQRVAWPVALADDKGYRADWIDEDLLQLGLQPVIPTAENQDRDQRPVKFNKRLDRCRRHHRKPDRPAQGKPPHFHPLRKNDQKRRRPDQMGLPLTIPAV